MALPLQTTSCENCDFWSSWKALYDVFLCDMSCIHYKHEWSHQGQTASLLPPTWSFLFIIYHLDKLLLILALARPTSTARPLPQSTGAVGGKKEERCRGGEGYFSFPWSLSDKPVCSFVSAATLNQEEVEPQEFGGPADKKSMCLTVFLTCRVTRDSQFGLGKCRYKRIERINADIFSFRLRLQTISGLLSEIISSKRLNWKYLLENTFLAFLIQWYKSYIVRCGSVFLVQRSR